MTRINPTFSLGCAMIAILSLTACAGEAKPKPVNFHPILPNGSVVLLDPTSDDGMLPALGEGLSRGAVTIYNLDGPRAPLPVRSAAPTPAAPMGYSGNGGMSALAAPTIQLREPANIARDDDQTDDSARVTIFGLDSGAPVVKRPVPVIAPAPMLPPLVEAAKPLQSPFAKDGTVILDNKPALDKKAAKKSKSKSKSDGPVPIALPPSTHSTTLGAGSRAVTATDLMGSDVPVSPMPPPLLPYPDEEAAKAVARPPKGMTY